MASVKVVSTTGAEVDSMQVSDKVFDAPLNATLIHQVALGYLDAKRQGNAETKTRKEVRGGGKKPFRQKGTGHARQGSTREPQMRGGGTVFGPHVRSYRKKTPVRMKRLALNSVLSDRVREDALRVVDALAFDRPKTSEFNSVLNSLNPEGRTALIVTNGVDANLLKSARNVPRVSIRTASDVNALDVLSAHRVYVTRDAVASLEERLG